MAADTTNPTPTETPAETPAAETPLKTAVEASLSSHLAHVKLPTAEETGEGDAAEEKAEEIKLPKTLKATLDLIAEGNAYQPKDAADAKRKANALEQLRAHAHALSQGTPAPVIYGKNHTALVNSSTNHAIEIHILQLRRADLILDGYLKNLEAKIKELTAAKK